MYMSLLDLSWVLFCLGKRVWFEGYEYYSDATTTQAFLGYVSLAHCGALMRANQLSAVNSPGCSAHLIFMCINLIKD